MTDEQSDRDNFDATHSCVSRSSRPPAGRHSLPRGHLLSRNNSPQIWRNPNGSVYVPAESVYAVFDAKQDLNRDTVLYAAEKVESVRRMERTSAPIPHAGGTYAPRELPHILGGILTLGSEWNPPFGDALLTAIRDSGEDVQRLDVGCAANVGAFSVLAGDPTTLEVWNSSAGTLVWFVTRLLAGLQALATVPAIDIARWADIALAEGLDTPASAEDA